MDIIDAIVSIKMAFARFLRYDVIITGCSPEGMVNL
jgi:hypothetical protein